MSNVCACPKPPGGSITCSDEQLAICGYQNGEIVSGCFDRPNHLQFIRADDERTLGVANWALSVIVGVGRSDAEPIDPTLMAVLHSGHYRNEQDGGILKFVLPADLDL